MDYKCDGKAYIREGYLSHPDKFMVIKLSTEKLGGLNFKLSFDSLLKCAVVTESQQLSVEGYAPYHATRLS